MHFPHFCLVEHLFDDFFVHFLVLREVFVLLLDFLHVHPLIHCLYHLDFLLVYRLYDFLLLFQLFTDLLYPVVSLGEGDFYGFHFGVGESFLLPDGEDALGLTDLLFDVFDVLDEGAGGFVGELPHDDLFEFWDGDGVVAGGLVRVEEFDLFGVEEFEIAEVLGEFGPVLGVEDFAALEEGVNFLAENGKVVHTIN